MMKGLDKDPVKRMQYQQLHETELKAEFIEPISEIEVNKATRKHFLMHFPVYKKDPLSTVLSFLMDH